MQRRQRKEEEAQEAKEVEEALLPPFRFSCSPTLVAGVVARAERSKQVARKGRDQGLRSDGSESLPELRLRFDRGSIREKTGKGKTISIREADAA
jgi:hypothetical protein